MKLGVVLRNVLRSLGVPTSYNDFTVGFYESEKGVNEYLHVSWSALRPKELVTALNEGKLSWDIEGKYLYTHANERIIAKTDTPYYGDILDHLVEEQAFFLPEQQ
jgi:hypothetical protein